MVETSTTGSPGTTRRVCGKGKKMSGTVPAGPAKTYTYPNASSDKKMLAYNTLLDDLGVSSTADACPGLCTGNANYYCWPNGISGTPTGITITDTVSPANAANNILTYTGTAGVPVEITFTCGCKSFDPTTTTAGTTGAGTTEPS